MKINSFKQCLVFAAIAAMMSAAGATRAAEQSSPSSYSSDLATLFNEHQRVLALRDACITAQPEKKSDMGGAYQDWLTRHSRIVDDLENRFAAVIKRASKDQADYTQVITPLVMAQVLADCE